MLAHRCLKCWYMYSDNKTNRKSTQSSLSRPKPTELFSLLLISDLYWKTVTSCSVGQKLMQVFQNFLLSISLRTNLLLFEPTCANARYALMHRFPSARLSVYYLKHKQSLLQVSWKEQWTSQTEKKKKQQVST